MLHNRTNSLNPLFKIDVTAISYVMATLVLTVLIIEMVASPGHRGVGVDLPPVDHPVNMLGAERNGALLVAIMRDGKIYFGNEQTTGEQLPGKIKERINRGAERKVYIKADARAKYGTVLILLEAVRSAGVEQVAFLTEQRKVAVLGP